MSPAVMPNPFVFVRIRFVHFHYTDNRAGSPMYYVALLLKGHAKIVSSKTTLEIRPGDVFFIPKQLPYQSYWSGQEEIEFFSYGFLQTQAREPLRFGLQVVDCGEALKKEIAQIPTEGASPGCEALSRFYGVLARLLPALQKGPFPEETKSCNRHKTIFPPIRNAPFRKSPGPVTSARPICISFFGRKSAAAPTSFGCN